MAQTVRIEDNMPETDKPQPDKPQESQAKKTAQAAPAKEPPAKKEEPIRLKCLYGNKVRLKNLDTGEISQYTLVTFSEERLSENVISNYTPIGRAIWAKHEGDEAEVEIPGKGIQRFRIISIENA